MRKRICILANCCLLFWFTFCLTGLSIGKHILVESAWGEIDTLMYSIYLVLFIFFIVCSRYGKYPLTIYCSLWLLTQFMCHEYYTIFGVSNDKLTQYQRNFYHTLQIMPHNKTIIIPDFYHVMLHLLIITVVISMILYCNSTRKFKINPYNIST